VEYAFDYIRNWVDRGCLFYPQISKHCLEKSSCSRKEDGEGAPLVAGGCKGRRVFNCDINHSLEKEFKMTGERNG
jgi:hypothetical protein